MSNSETHAREIVRRKWAEYARKAWTVGLMMPETWLVQVLGRRPTAKELSAAESELTVLARQAHDERFMSSRPRVPR